MTCPRPKLRRRLARLAVTLLAVTTVWACNAPFIPVPPPNQVTFTTAAVDDGSGGQKTVWITHGGPGSVAASAVVYIYDLDHGAGVLQQAGTDGSYDAPAMDGTRGDRVRVYYQTTEGEYSQDTCRLLMEGADQAPPCQ
jgi:hypothetical protein